MLGIVSAVTYFFLADETVPGIYSAVWKGLGVGLLAAFAWMRGRGPDGTLIAIVLTLCAVADVVLEFSFLGGAAIFGLAHLVAIGLYLRNRRLVAAGSQRVTGIALLIGVPLISALITWPRENWHLAAGYAVLLGAMSASAWTSRFPRYRVGLGAVFFVLSDLAIFAREAGRLDADITGWLIWPLYFAGQLMIATGVVQTLRGEKSLDQKDAPENALRSFSR
ncbi:lysoplasmalogenase [Qipengyuania spongiae]|uniref:Lysoplasmalogenase n=1 Tax=Qipengyuania spongiae TaxID=2909673 RepID=A0ABY5T0Y0_9SPHN|nr:lysoplasmalogenase [Qipengyuania spongiae]UVI38901.1 lysoplasmalogenase [Qipengyuania spongiae]